VIFQDAILSQICQKQIFAHLRDLQGKTSLRYAGQASAIQTVPPLCSKRASKNLNQKAKNGKFHYFLIKIT